MSQILRPKASKDVELALSRIMRHEEARRLYDNGLAQTPPGFCDLAGLSMLCIQLPGARLPGARLNRAELNDANLIGAKLNGAELWNTTLTLDLSILTADFMGARFLDKALFLRESDKRRIVGVSVDEATGRLVPASKRAAKTEAKQKFGSAALNVVYFADIYPALLERAQNMGYLPK